MTPHYFTLCERREHLVEVVDAQRSVEDVAAELVELRSFVPQLEAARSYGEILLESGFTQDDLSKLNRAIPNVLRLYPHWEPPIEQMPDGRWQEASWYVVAGPRLWKLHEAAQRLRVVAVY